MNDRSVLSNLAGPPMSVRRRALNRGLLRLPPASRRRAQYLLAHDRLLRLRYPQRWTEKVNWRMVYDRRELIAMTCDKLSAKAWVERMAAPDTVAVPRTVWSGADPADLAHLDWPDSWVLKPNHGTGHVQLGTGRPGPDRLSELIDLARCWLTEPGPEIWGEWGYSRARRLIVLEEAVPDTPVTGRTDYKFFVTNGAVQLVYVDTGRFGQHRRQFHTSDGQPIDGQTGLPTASTITSIPTGWDTMARVAGKLGAAFDAIRVDLYLQDGIPWFGELSAYDASGLSHFPTPAIDAALGATWQLPVDIDTVEVVDYDAEGS